MTSVGVAVLVAIGIAGHAYYSAPLAGRVRSDMHAWLRPSGYVGQTAGIIAFLFFLFIWLYPVRKRFPKLAFTGPVCRWLDLHVVAGLLIPLLVATHAAWRFTGVIGLGYGAMVLVCISGVVGRYLYVRIPRSRTGLELSLEEVQAERVTLLGQITRETGLTAETVSATLEPKSPPKSGGIGAALAHMVADDFARRRAARRLLDECKRSGRDGAAPRPAVLRRVVRLARQQMALDQQVRMLDATHRVFRFWHAAHRPVALAALLAVVIHVVVVIAMGSTWFS